MTEFLIITSFVFTYIAGARLTFEFTWRQFAGKKEYKKSETEVLFPAFGWPVFWPIYLGWKVFDCFWNFPKAFSKIGTFARSLKKQRGTLFKGVDKPTDILLGTVLQKFIKNVKDIKIKPCPALWTDKYQINEDCAIFWERVFAPHAYRRPT